MNFSNGQTVQNSNNFFSWFDYLFFVGMLTVSMAIGIYFGFFSKKQGTADEYLKGGKQMKVIPIAISLIASQISALTLLAVPADIYKFGSNYVWLTLGTIIECTIAYYVYLPVFFNLQLTSVYEYVSLRFNNKLRILTSFFAVLSILLYCPVVIYVPSLAFSQVTGVQVHLIAGITSAVCVCYTTFGGLKAVVWTDTVQFFIMITAFMVIFTLGISAVGGIDFIWSKCVEGGRLDVLDFSFDPTLRDSFGALVIGGTVQWLASTAVYQGAVQKMLAVPTYKHVTKVMPLYVLGLVLIQFWVTSTGLLLYARYWNCDPLSVNKVSRAEQLVPYFVMQVTDSVPGLPGIFVAGVYSAGLSSLSADLNNLAAIIYQDFISPFMSKSTSQKRISNILKSIVLIGGVLSTLLVLVIEKLGRVFEAFTALTAISIGPTLGVFTLGMLIPKANSKGAFFGAAISAAVVAWIAVQNQRYQTIIVTQFLKPISTDGCNYTTSEPTEMIHTAENAPFILYRISFWFYSSIGATLTVFFGLIISCFTKHDKEDIPLQLLSPVIHFLVKKTKPSDDADVSAKFHTEEGLQETLLKK